MTFKLSDFVGYEPIQSKENLLQTLQSNVELRYNQKICDPSTFIGIEVEVEEAHCNDAVNLSPIWEIEEDRSLRGVGREFKSIPIRGANIPFALQILEDYFKWSRDNLKRGAFAFSERCSIHIHQNIRNLTVEQLGTLLIAYFVLEPLYFKFSAKSGWDRWDNIFCVPLRKSSDSLDLFYIFKNLIGRKESASVDAQIASNYIQTWRKYAALNLIPIGGLGTIEFRHMGGNLNIPLILNWINLIQRLKRFCYVNKIEDVKNQIFELNTSSQYDWFVRQVLDNYYNLVDVSNLKEDMEEGVTLIKEFFSIQQITSYKYIKCTVEEVLNSSLSRYFKHYNIDLTKKRIGIYTENQLRVLARCIYVDVYHRDLAVSELEADRLSQNKRLPHDLTKNEYGFLRQVSQEEYGYTFKYKWTGANW